jgi:hypothetical protein
MYLEHHAALRIAPDARLRLQKQVDQLQERIQQLTQVGLNQLAMCGDVGVGSMHMLHRQ